MSRRREERTTTKRQWLRLGLLLVSLFLGHDLLMIAEPVHTVAAQDTSRMPAHAKAAVTRELNRTPSDHPTNCRIGQSALTRGADSFERGNQDLAISNGIVDTRFSAHGEDSAFLWEEPHWPPGTLRALFQVYRI